MPSFTALFLTALLAAALPAQQGNKPPPSGAPGGVVEWPERRPDERLPRGVDPYYVFPGVESVAPQFRGFPLYAPDSPAFGGYPGFPGFRPEVLQARGDDPTKLLLPQVLARPEGMWPSWLSPGGGAGDEKARPDQGKLVRVSDRVWYRGRDEEAYVPLPFHDRIRTFESGAGMQVRTMSGDFVVYLHDAASIQSVGPVHIEALSLGEALAEFELLDVFHLRLDARKRAVRLRMPDTSVLEVVETEVRMDRVDDRITVFNAGSNPLRIQAPFGVVELPANRQVTLLTTPPPEAGTSTAFWVEGSAQSRVDGARATVAGGSAGGAAEWLGVRVKIPAGGSAVFEAIGAESFPEYRSGQPAGGKESGR